MRLMATGCTLLAVLVLAMMPAASQDRGGPKKGETNDCDLKTTVKGYWCEKCDAILGKEDIDKKKKWHKKCEEKPLQVLICIKKCYQADCHDDKISKKPVS